MDVTATRLTKAAAVAAATAGAIFVAVQIGTRRRVLHDETRSGWSAAAPSP